MMFVFFANVSNPLTFFSCQMSTNVARYSTSFNKETGVFQTWLLWKGKPDLVNNYAAAKARLNGLMRRLRKDPNVKAAYKSVIQEFIDQSTVELVTSETLAQMMESSRMDLYFLPHLAVYDPGLNQMSGGNGRLGKDGHGQILK